LQQSIEQIILSNLCYNEEYLRKVIPFLKPEYFSRNEDRIVFNKIATHTETYNAAPSKQALMIAVTDDKAVTESEFSEIQAIVDTLDTEDADSQWLLDETQKFCKDRALYNAVM